MVDEVGEAGVNLLFLLFEHCLLRLHALALGVGFLLAACQLILLLVELHLALLDAVLALLYLLVVLAHLFLELCALAQELLLYLKQFLLLDDFCLFLGCFASFLGKSLPLDWHHNEVPHSDEGKESYDSDQKGDYNRNCHVVKSLLLILGVTFSYFLMSAASTSVSSGRRACNTGSASLVAS